MRLRTGRRRCVCRPVYRAQVEEARRTGTVVQTPESVPAPLWRCGHGLPAPRRRRPRADPGTQTVIAIDPRLVRELLRLHVLPHVDERRRAPFGALPADVVDGRTLQAMVNAVTAGASPAVAGVADAAASAVLRDLYERGLLEVIPPRTTLPRSRARRSDLRLARAAAQESPRQDHHAPRPSPPHAGPVPRGRARTPVPESATRAGKGITDVLGFVVGHEHLLVMALA